MSEPASVFLEISSQTIFLNREPYHASILVLYMFSFLRLSTRRGLPLRSAHESSFENAAPCSPRPPLPQRDRCGGDHRSHPARNRVGAVPAGRPVHLHLGPQIAGLYRLPPADLVPARPHQA